MNSTSATIGLVASPVSVASAAASATSSSTTSSPNESSSPALKFKVVATWRKARACVMTLPHGECLTPMFMPVGTQGTLKGVAPEQLYDLGCPLILSNTYHLGHRPGGDVLEAHGGLHKFMNWNRNLLTDSGGFQMVSLSKLADVTEHGVQFQSPHDGSIMVLTPEESMKIQNQIGADIMMALDDVVSSTTTGARVEEATARTLRWIDRCIAAHRRPLEQNLFGITQGGLDASLRERCIKEMIQRPLPGFAIGGLSGGESKDLFWRMVHLSTDLLPANKPRYLMGVGFAVDLVVCAALGVDMFDCVFPTRTARFGCALVRSGQITLKAREFARDERPIDADCMCFVCKHYTRGYLHHAMRDAIGVRLLTIHNVAYQLRLMKDIRDSIINGTLETCVQQFFLDQFPDKKYPSWTVDALHAAGITLVN